MTSKPLINDALRLARLYWGFSQSEIADEMGVSQSIISEIENYKKSPSFDMIERYSHALGIKTSSLVFFAEELVDSDLRIKGKTIFAKTALEFLEKIKPSEVK
jgi:transcriptional regulator with XRE-family HTH domain